MKAFVLHFRGICSGKEAILRRLEETIWRLCKGYFELYKQQSESQTLQNAQKDEFFGLRDFYRLEVCSKICVHLCSSYALGAIRDFYCSSLHVFLTHK